MYNEFYGFSEKPFEITPDPKFLYLSRTHREALDGTIKSIKNRAPFTSITGEAGTGKTILIYSIFIRLDEKVKTTYIFYPSVTFTELIWIILQDLDQKVIGKSKEVLLRQLNEYLLKKLATDETLAVFIDEAQNLPQEVMVELGKLEERISGVSDRLQIIFVGQPEFEGKLNSPGLEQLSQRIGIKYQIRPLTKEESIEYIDYRLTIAGSRASEVFTPNAISMVTDHAKGIPRVINILCDNTFLMGYGLSRKNVDSDIVGQVIREMEGPVSHKLPSTEILTSVKQFHWMSFRHNSPRWTISFLILSLLCLGGLVHLMHGVLQRNPAVSVVGSIESIRGNTEISSTKKISEVSDSLRKQDSKSTVLQPVSHSPASQSPKHEKPELAEIVVVERGQSISLLAQKYYRMTNLTLADLILDFNPEINNAHLIQVGQKIRIPKITKECLINESPDHIWKIHAGTFKTPGFAKSYRNEPIFKGKIIEILPRKVSPTDTWYRVMVGTFDNRDEASKAIDLLKGKGLLPLFGGIPKPE
jgi:general secretion pathway protein A